MQIHGVHSSTQVSTFTNEAKTHLSSNQNISDAAISVRYHVDIFLVLTSYIWIFLSLGTIFPALVPESSTLELIAHMTRITSRSCGKVCLISARAPRSGIVYLNGVLQKTSALLSYERNR